MKDAKMETTVIEANEKSSICDMLSRAHQADLAKARRAERVAVLEEVENKLTYRIRHNDEMSECKTADRSEDYYDGAADEDFYLREIVKEMKEATK